MCSQFTRCKIVTEAKSTMKCSMMIKYTYQRKTQEKPHNLNTLSLKRWPNLNMFLIPIKKNLKAQLKSYCDLF